jgi:hypothetical protein
MRISRSVTFYVFVPTLVLLLGLVGLPGTGSATTWNVPAQAPTIQAGIDSAGASDTVVVACGTYTWTGEGTGDGNGLIHMKSGIHLTSETGEYDCVTIDAEGLGRVMYFDEVNNTATVEGFTLKGGGGTISRGCGAYLYRSSPTIRNCHITDNHLTEWSGSGAGIALWEYCDPVITGCVFSGNTTITPGSSGGGIYMYYQCDPIITNCTFYGNEGGSGSQILLWVLCHAQVDRCILTEGTYAQAVFCGSDCSATLTCTDVHSNPAGDWVGCIAGQEGTNGNISADPLLCDPSTNNFHLAAGSPCLIGPCGQMGALGMGCAGPVPHITGVTDVGNDQGRWVRLVWMASMYDAPVDTVDITGYEIYRRQDEYLREPARAKDAEASEPFMLGAPLASGWDYLGNIPAHGESLYQYVAPTLCDSTDQGICWSVFVVRATTPDPFTYFDSQPDSGYSIDNLAPAPPPGLTMTTPTELAWEEVPDEDFDYYSVYGSPVTELDETATLIGYTVDTMKDIAGHVYDYYHVTATDFSGNEGEETSVGNTYAGVPDPGVPVNPDPDGRPASFALRQNHPNPFDANTVIGFDVPEARRVSLTVFGAQGRVIEVLTDREYGPGRHAVVWDGTDKNGNMVATGIYFVRMQAADFEAMKRVILLR